MTRHDITPRQAEKLYAALLPTLGFLTQLDERLGELGLPADDPYRSALREARDAYRALTAATLALGRPGGEGRPARP